ncbi:MAG: transposase [Cytophagales bacterium]|nr:transposase [Cytophagales bacterium]
MDQAFIQALKGKRYADKGCLSKELTKVLFMNGLHLITSIRNNMKNTKRKTLKAPSGKHCVRNARS